MPLIVGATMAIGGTAMSASSSKKRPRSLIPGGEVYKEFTRGSSISRAIQRRIESQLANVGDFELFDKDIRDRLISERRGRFDEGAERARQRIEAGFRRRGLSATAAPQVTLAREVEMPLEKSVAEFATSLDVANIRAREAERHRLEGLQGAGFQQALQLSGFAAGGAQPIQRQQSDIAGAGESLAGLGGSLIGMATLKRMFGDMSGGGGIDTSNDTLFDADEEFFPDETDPLLGGY